jgi:hypothetical protein
MEPWETTARALVAWGVTVGLASVSHGESLVQVAAREKERRGAPKETYSSYTNDDLGRRAEGRRAAARPWAQPEAARVPQRAPAALARWIASRRAMPHAWAPLTVGLQPQGASSAGAPAEAHAGPAPLPATVDADSRVVAGVDDRPNGIRDVHDLGDSCLYGLLGPGPAALTLVQLGQANFCFGGARGVAGGVSVDCVYRPQAYGSCTSSAEYVITDATGQAWWTGVSCGMSSPGCPTPPAPWLAEAPVELADGSSNGSSNTSSQPQTGTVQPWVQRIVTDARITSPGVGAPAPSPGLRPWNGRVKSWSSFVPDLPADAHVGVGTPASGDPPRLSVTGPDTESRPGSSGSSHGSWTSSVGAGSSGSPGGQPRPRPDGDESSSGVKHWSRTFP